MRLYNKHNPFPVDAVYVGRPSKWGNPFKIGKDGSREEVIEKYRRWLLGTVEGNLLMRDAQVELRGQSLVCWCAPAPCHADVLLVLANQPTATGDNNEPGWGTPRV